MFDIGWSELMLIGIVALIVVGPKDLPGMFRTLGRFTAKARSMGREFQRAMDDAARESGVSDTAKDLKAMTSKKSLGLDALDKAASSFEKWQPNKPSTTPKGPATQALTDKKAAEAVERKVAAKAAPKATAASAAPESAPTKKKVAAKATAKPTAAKPTAAKPTAAKPTASTARPAATKATAVKKPAAGAKKPTRRTQKGEA